MITRDEVSRTTPHHSWPRTPVPVSPPEARPERDCANGQEHHGAGDVEQHEPFLEEYLWGGGFWEESYYVGTAGDVSTDTIEQYIERTEHV